MGEGFLSGFPGSDARQDGWQGLESVRFTGQEEEDMVEFEMAFVLVMCFSRCKNSRMLDFQLPLELGRPPFGDLKHAKTGRVDLVASGQGPRTLS